MNRFDQQNQDIAKRIAKALENIAKELHDPNEQPIGYQFVAGLKGTKPIKLPMYKAEKETMMYELMNDLLYHGLPDWVDWLYERTDDELNKLDYTIADIKAMLDDYSIDPIYDTRIKLDDIENRIKTIHELNKPK